MEIKRENRWNVLLPVIGLLFLSHANDTQAASLAEIDDINKVHSVLKMERCARNFTCKSRLRQLIIKTIHAMNKASAKQEGGFVDLRVSAQVAHPYDLYGNPDFTKAFFSSSPYNGTPGHKPKIRVCTTANSSICTIVPIKSNVVYPAMKTLDYYLKHVCLKYNAQILQKRDSEMKKAMKDIEKLKKQDNSWKRAFKDPNIWADTLYHALNKNMKPTPFSAVSMVINKTKNGEGNVIIGCYADRAVPVSYYSDGTFGKVNSKPKGWSAFTFTIPLPQKTH